MGKASNVEDHDSCQGIWSLGPQELQATSCHLGQNTRKAHAECPAKDYKMADGLAERLLDIWGSGKGCQHTDSLLFQKSQESEFSHGLKCSSGLQILPPHSTPPQWVKPSLGAEPVSISRRACGSGLPLVQIPLYWESGLVNRRGE